MKIVHTLLRYPPATGGVEEYTRELVERLRGYGEDVTVETTTLKTHHPPSVLPPVTTDPPYVHRHAAQTFDAIGYPIPQGLREELSSLPMDILHAHAFWYAPADIAARVAKKRGIPFVLNPYYANTGNRRTVKWQLYRILYGRATVAAADAIVVISPFEHALLKSDRFLLPRVELIPPGVDQKELDALALNPFPAWNVPAGDVLLFVGRIAQSKGLDLLIRAFAAVRGERDATRLVVIGEDFGYQQECALLAEKLGVSEAITWTGRASRRELLGAYRHAALFAFPSRYEAFGIVALEASAMGCPVVATRATAIPFVVKDGVTGLLFTPEDVGDLTKQILTLLRDHELAVRLGREGFWRARREFAWEKSVGKLHALYEDLLKRKNTKRRTL